MVQIGYFTATESGFKGKIQTLGIAADIALYALPGADVTTPDYRVLHGIRPIGWAWRCQTRTGVAFIAIAISDPAFVDTVRAILMQPKGDETFWPMLWDRAGETA